MLSSRRQASPISECPSELVNAIKNSSKRANQCRPLSFCIERFGSSSVVIITASRCVISPVTRLGLRAPLHSIARFSQVTAVCMYYKRRLKTIASMCTLICPQSAAYNCMLATGANRQRLQPRNQTIKKPIRTVWTQFVPKLYYATEAIERMIICRVCLALLHHLLRKTMRCLHLLLLQLLLTRCLRTEPPPLHLQRLPRGLPTQVFVLNPCLRPSSSSLVIRI